MNSLKALVGVVPNGAITYISKLYPGSISDKKIVEGCGILTHFLAEDLILADKGFLIEDIVPVGVSVNIPPFLQHGKFTRSEASATKEIAKCRIHVPYSSMAKKSCRQVFQLVGTLVNFQLPLIKEGWEGTVVD